MKELFEFKKYFVFLKKYTERFRYGNSADLDWEIILTVFVVLNLVSLVVGVMLFLGVRTTDGTKDLSKSSVVQGTFSRSALNDTLEVYRSKKSALETLSNTPVTVPDPSL